MDHNKKRQKKNASLRSLKGGRRDPSDSQPVVAALKGQKTNKQTKTKTTTTTKKTQKTNKNLPKPKTKKSHKQTKKRPRSNIKLNI